MMKKSDNIIDLGQWRVPTSWNDISLGVYQEIERFYDDKDREFDMRDILHILCGKSIDEINALPFEFLEDIMNHLTFLQSRPLEKEASNSIEINGETYTIHTENKLRVGEFIAVDTCMKNDKHKYSGILAILCRKEGELYDSRFENEVLDERIEMWEKVPVVDVLGLISFFLSVYITSIAPTLLSLRAREIIDLTRKDIETSHKSGVMSRRSMKSAMKELKKLEKSINTI